MGIRDKRVPCRWKEGRKEGLSNRGKYPLAHRGSTRGRGTLRVRSIQGGSCNSDRLLTKNDDDQDDLDHQGEPGQPRPQQRHAGDDTRDAKLARLSEQAESTSTKGGYSGRNKEHAHASRTGRRTTEGRPSYKKLCVKSGTRVSLGDGRTNT